ncbi:DegT/DnrJ/EryC1/StrS family aminotransferase [bacterium]|nr:DegT/DnrJ/EryC1/StrS family aminotransferase [bacterium]
MEKLALHGGDPVRAVPLDPNRLRPLRFDQREKEALLRVVDSGVLCRSFGSEALALEKEFARYFGLPHATACSSGTAAIHTALAGVGVGWRDEVITSPITDQGSIIPIIAQGALPVFADVDPETFNMSPEAVARVVTPRTKAILLVHLAGLASGLDEIKALARSRGIALVEDCAQSWLAGYKGALAGTFGAVGCFSYNGYKHIECGDGGVCVTSDPEVARRMRLFVDKCYDRTGGARNPQFFGMNYRMTEIQAAVARVQLTKLERIIARRRQIADTLLSGLRGVPGLRLPVAPEGCDHSWWYFVLRAERGVVRASASELAAALAAEGLPAWTGYCGGRPVYLYECFQDSAVSPFALPPLDPQGRELKELYPAGLCPVAENLLDEMIILSMNEFYQEKDVADILAGVRKVFSWYAAN